MYFAVFRMGKTLSAQPPQPQLGASQPQLASQQLDSQQQLLRWNKRPKQPNKQQRRGLQHGSQQLSSQPQLGSAQQLGSAAQVASSAQQLGSSQQQLSSQQQSLWRWNRPNRQQRWPQPESQQAGSQQPQPRLPKKPKHAEALLALESTTAAPRISAAKPIRRFIGDS